MSQNVESEISKIDDFLKQLGGGGGQASSSSSSKGTVSKFRECFVRIASPLLYCIHVNSVDMRSHT